MKRFRLDRRAFLAGSAGMALALPALDAMGDEVAGEVPRRFCGIYTANGMALPRAEHGISEWSWFPRRGEKGELVYGNSTKPLLAYQDKISFFGGMFTGSGIDWSNLPCN